MKEILKIIRDEKDTLLIQIGDEVFCASERLRNSIIKHLKSYHHPELTKAIDALESSFGEPIEK